MKYFELHNELARAIGDYVVCTDSVVPNGVRYSKQMRDAYLMRAMSDIQLTALYQVISLPRDVKNKVLYSLFPNMISASAPTLGIGVTAWVIPNKCFHFSWLSVDNVQVPIADNLYAVKQYMSRAKMQASDPFGTVENNTLTVYGLDSAIMHYLGCQYIKGVPTLDDTTLPTAENLFEPMWLSQVILKASAYAQFDSGDLGSSAQAYPILSIPTQIQQGK